jgi:hypothetical protein
MSINFSTTPQYNISGKSSVRRFSSIFMRTVEQAERRGDFNRHSGGLRKYLQMKLFCLLALIAIK